MEHPRRGSFGVLSQQEGVKIVTRIRDPWADSPVLRILGMSLGVSLPNGHLFGGYYLAVYWSWRLVL